MYIIDADTYAYKLAYFNEQSYKEEVIKENVISYMTRTLLDIIVDTDKITNDDYILLLSSKTNKRKKDNKDYKKNRTQSFKWLSFIYKIIKENFNTLTIQDYEADDIAATIMKQNNYKDILVHEDKDLNQIPGIHIFRGNLTLINEIDAYKFLMHQMLMGDSADDVSGVKGIGKKTADKLLNEKTLIDILEVVLEKYVECYKEDGLRMFSVNYNLLKLKTNVEITDGTKEK